MKKDSEEKFNIEVHLEARASEGLSTTAYLTAPGGTNRLIKEHPKIQTYLGSAVCEISGYKFLMGKERYKSMRGKIEDFSKKSRFRLIRLLGTINESKCGLPDFVALTYPGEWSCDGRVWKRDLDAMIKAIVRQYRTVWGVWRLEFQERGAPHFHLLLWDGPGTKGISRYSLRAKKLKWIIDKRDKKNQKIMNWFSESWYRIVGSEDPKHLKAGTRIEPIQTMAGVRYYVSKYLAKLPDGRYTPEGFVGRFWGRIGKERWKVNEITTNLSDKAFWRLRRVLRKYQEGKSNRLKNVNRRSFESWTGLTTYIDESVSSRAIEWAKESDEEGG